MELPIDLSSFETINQFKPTVKLADLTVGEKYLIKNIKRITTQYGEAVVVDLEDKQVFLPKRYNKMTQANFNQITYYGSYYLTYLGPYKETSKIKIEYHLSYNENEK